MKVTITYYDHSSLTKEEVIRNARELFGEYTEVSVAPSSAEPVDMIYFALQQVLTYEQLSLLFDSEHLYTQKITELKSRVLNLVSKELDSVIKDNEVRVS